MFADDLCTDFTSGPVAVLIDRAAIERLIPHSGSMCLLDTVVEWDSDTIVCGTASHRRADNPLLDSDGRLPAVILVEYGAQAAAVHAGLLQQTIGQGATAYIGAVKDLQLHAAVVDASIDVLQIQAQCLLTNNDGAIYRIQCGTEHCSLVTARVLLVLPN